MLCIFAKSIYRVKYASDSQLKSILVTEGQDFCLFQTLTSQFNTANNNIVKRAAIIDLNEWNVTQQHVLVLSLIFLANWASNL